ncbi:MAG: hypothetical protein RLN90_09595 [Balneolaceae bacterium]
MSTITKKQIDSLDAKFEQKLNDAVHQVSDTEFTVEKAKARRDKANRSDLAFCKIYYPRLFDCAFNDLHKEVATWKVGNYTLSGSRRFGKSAFVYVGKLIKHIARGTGGIVNVTLYDSDNAKERTASLSRILLNNKLLCYDYGIEVVQDLKGHHIFKSDGGQTVLIATSVRQGLRAIMDDEFNRFTLSVHDDLYSRQSLSELMVEKVVNFVVSEAWGQMEPDGLSITIGNAITETAPIVKLKEEYTDKSGKHFGLPAMNKAETKSNWPERFSFEQLVELFKSQLPYDVWMGDYMDTPVEVGDIFKPEWLRYTSNLNLIKIITSISALDPSHGDSPAACDKGGGTLGIDEKKNTHVLDQYLRKEGYEQVFDYYKHIHEVMPNHKVILFENDFSQWNFAKPYYDQWRAKTNTVLPLVMFHSKDLSSEHYGADKDGRMLNLVHPLQTGQMSFEQSLKNDPDHIRFKNTNYLRFGKHKKVKLDGLDALATLYLMIWGYITTGAFKSLKNKSFQKSDLEGWFR